MVPKKHKSKRISASDRYKVEKKVKDHHRKMRKESKKNKPLTRKLKKDPGIPNLFPLKEKLLQQAMQAKEQRLLEKSNSGKKSLSDYAAEAARKSQLFHSQLRQQEQLNPKENLIPEAVLSNKDNSKKAYYKEFRKVVEEADVILEVLDARDPIGCRTKQIEELILTSFTNKRIILILNKIDLVPREIVEQWLKYFRNEFPTIAFKSSTQSQRQNLSQNNKISIDIASQDLLNSSECLGADTLLKLLKNYCRNNKIKTSITVGVMGYPNTGKSSLINSLKRSKVCNVGSTPGLTKSSQLIHLDKNIKLLDCPGIVFGKEKDDSDSCVVLRNCVKVELLSDPISPVESILSKCSHEQLRNLYKVSFFADTRDFLLQVAMKRGKLKRGGIPDLENAARSILQDWNQGRIPYYTLPPDSGIPVESQVSSALVSSWSAEFSMPEIVSVEGKDLALVKGKSEFAHRMLVMKEGLVSQQDMSDVEQDDEEEMEMEI